jgi:hypothetical protein
MDLEREGLYFRGNFERQRQNYGKAYDAFKAAGNYKDSLHKLAIVMLEASQPPETVIEHFLVAFESGQLISLPWLHVLIGQQETPHPRAKEIEQIFETYRQEKHPQVIGQMGEIMLKGKSYDEALIYFKDAALSGDNYSKQLLGEILADRAWWSEIYERMLNEEIFDFRGFPFTPTLEPIGEVNPLFRDELNVTIPEETYKLISWFFDQGPAEIRHYRSCFAMYKCNVTVKKLAAIAEYDEKFRSTFGYEGSIAEDPNLLIVFANDLLQCSRIPDLGLFEFLLARFGVQDLFDEMVKDVMASESKKQIDTTFTNITSFAYEGDFSLSRAISTIPVDYSLPRFNKFIEFCETLDFESAELVISDLLEEAKSEKSSSIQEFANLLEFTDRAKFEFDFLPWKLHETIKDRLLEALRNRKSTELKNYLLAFKPNGERPYYLDDYELILTGKEK